MEELLQIKEHFFTFESLKVSDMTSDYFDIENLIIYAPELEAQQEVDTPEPQEATPSSTDIIESRTFKNLRKSRAETTVTPTIENKRIIETRARTKGKVQKEECLTNKRKAKRNSGQEYIGISGKLVAAKEFVDNPCNCRMQCDTKISARERKMLFDIFWDLQDFNLQNISLHGMVRAEEVERRRAVNNNRGPRMNTFHYYLQPNASAEPLRVCKRYFLETFQISHGRLYRCCSKSALEAVVDHRGNPGDDKEQRRLQRTHAEQHCEQFALYKERYLSASLTIRKMYELYKQECEEQQQLPLSEAYYYQVMDTQLSLKLLKDKKRLQRRRKKALLKRMYSRGELLRIVKMMVRLRKTHKLKCEQSRRTSTERHLSNSVKEQCDN